MTKFGRTWWGSQWLHALDRIDFSNRLERGRRYANNGSVKSIKINGNLIEAKVQGSRPRPYDVNIVVPPFFDPEKKVFMESIRQSPLVLSRLLNRELPQEMLQIGEKNNIKVFPQSWQDIKLNCSCPDWAVPCKHLAAVIYMVANEIDQNPFLVFKLHGFDLIEELAKQKIQIGNLQKEHIFSLQDCIAPIAKKTKTQSPSTSPRSASPLSLGEGSGVRPPDFSIIENLLPTLPALFPANALFYSGDFKSLLPVVYKKAAKMETEALQEKKKNPRKAEEDFRFNKFQLLFSPSGNATVEMTIQDFSSEKKEEKKSLILAELLLLLAQTESKHLENYSPSFVALYRTFRYCNILVERGAILPRLFHCEGDNYKILWQPALLNDSVKNVFDALLPWIPEDLVWIEKSNLKPPASRKLPSKTSRESKSSPLRGGAGASLLCSFFLNPSIKNCAQTISALRSSAKQDAKILELFFNDRTVSFSGFNEKEIPNTIQLWLKRFFLSDKNVTPILSVSESPGKFTVETLVKRSDSKLQQVEPLHNFLSYSGDEDRMLLLKDLNLLSEYYPDLNKIIQSQGKEKLTYEFQTFSEVLLKILPALKLFGIKALLPKSLQQLLRPQVSLQLRANKKNKSYFSLEGLMDYDWKVAMGDSFISRAEFEQLAKTARGLVKIRDQYIMVSEEDVAKIIRALEKPAVPGSFQLLQAALSGEYENAAVQMDDELKRQIKELLKEEETPLPSSLVATLRPYQHRGFNWMYKNARLGLGSVLADDMGLGKTLQVITALLKMKEDGALKENPALVIVPTTLLTNWSSEIKKFAPSLRAHVFHGPGRKFTVKDTDVVITTFGVARSDNEKFAKLNWHVTVVDEAQNIKNPEIAQTKAVKKIRSKIKIAMSGTPVENRLSEYWSIFDFANPNYLGGLNWFSDEYAKPIEINQDRKKLEKFKVITSPFIMRRVKTDKTIISDLPDKIENNQLCHLTKEQAAIYHSIAKELMAQVEHAEGIDRRGLVLKLLMVLKQVCNHPAQYLKNDSISPELSGKTMLLLQLLETIYENNEKVLIFSQFQEMGTILRQIIHTHFGKKALQLHGGCSRKERDEMVQAFQNNRQCDTFILSIKAGGTGLNLTAAANVIHYDLWWNPAVEAQATDRAFRIGQKQNVMVHRMITKGTLEEKIDEMIRSKKALANLTVSSGEKWIGELSDKELKSLIAMESGKE